MNPTNSNLELPTPVEQPDSSVNQPQQNSAVNPNLNQPAPPNFGATSPFQPTPPPPPHTSAPTPTSATATKSSKSGLLKDKDLIDKEWVNKVREISRQTKDDPYTQCQRITALKQEYRQSMLGASS
jgi:hypothetical protein